MATISINYQYTLWTGIEAYCPICKKIFAGWYCPSCGLPKKNSKYAIDEEWRSKIHNCGQYHFRPEFSQFEDFQLCDKCYTTNPFKAKYCRNCKNKLTSNGVTKDAHGWVDLGLSVLWATETMGARFRWMSCVEVSQYDGLDVDYRGEGKDAATEIWGAKWRTPTKDEFEELMLKCKWERCIDPMSKKYALKATGPNGNYIMLKLSEYNNILLWTSTEYPTEFDGKRAYEFQFNNDIKIEKTLTDKQKKEIEYNAARSKREYQRFNEKLYRGLDYDFKAEWEADRQFKEKERDRLVQENRILSAMGDDRKEREYNQIADKEKQDLLWLSTPVEFKFNEENVVRNTLAVTAKRWTRTILPVADKKWKGQL